MNAIMITQIYFEYFQYLRLVSNSNLKQFIPLFIQKFDSSRHILYYHSIPSFRKLLDTVFHHYSYVDRKNKCLFVV
jgi:hypothetical protein